VRAPAAAALAAVALAGCGTPSADLFAVERSGRLPDAKLQLIVVDDGTVRCDGRDEIIDDDVLLDARQLERELAPLMEEGVRLRVPPQALLRFRVISDEGEVTFADATPNLPPELGRLVAFTRKVAREQCGLDR
jgi:hypothetical protein